jgi:hypothetical protein
MAPFTRNVPLCRPKLNLRTPQASSTSTTEQLPEARHRYWRPSRSRRRRIYDVPQRLKKDAAGWPALLRSDSDEDGYSNEVELMFGAMPGRRSSNPSRPAAQLERWRAIIVREVRGRQIAQLELDTRVRRLGPDTDGDRVPNVLERFVGSDPRSRTSTPLVAARRLAVYRQLLHDAGVPIR